MESEISDMENFTGDVCENDDDETSPESRLLLYAKTGNVNEIRRLLSSESVDANAVSEKESACQGLSALHLAVRHNHIKCAKLLLAYGADVNKADNFGFRPIHDACLHGNSEALKLLLKHDAKTDGIEKKGLHNITPALYAARQNQLGCLKMLSNKSPLDHEVLWDTSSKRGVMEILDYLPSREMHQDMLPKLFQNSALAGHSGFIRTFLRSFRYKFSDDVVRTALFTAAQHGHIEYLVVLLEYGVDPDMRDNKNTTALHNAARFGQLECITELVQSGANIEAVTDQRWTPLHTAVRQCQEEAVALLIELGSNINAKGGPMDETPLHIAATIGDVPVLRKLLEGSPNILATDKSGKSVLQIDIRKSIKDTIIKYAKS